MMESIWLKRTGFLAGQLPNMVEEIWWIWPDVCLVSLSILTNPPRCLLAEFRLIPCPCAEPSKVRSCPLAAPQTIPAPPHALGRQRGGKEVPVPPLSESLVSWGCPFHCPLKVPGERLPHSASKPWRRRRWQLCPQPFRAVPALVQEHGRGGGARKKPVAATL